MCGIFAIIHKDQKSVESSTLKMCTDKLRHRGPDGEGFYIDHNLGLGHRRLAIIDLTDKASQPMHKHSRVIAYNGEIYNFQEIRKDLESMGEVFTSDSDTEVILSAYHHWGPGMETRFNGMWAFLIWDTEKRQLYVSRDRYGMKPLYKYETETSIYFSSEIKAFHPLNSWSGLLNTEVVNDYLVNGMLHHRAESLYQDVDMIPQSTYLILDQKGELISQSHYFNLIELLVNNDSVTPAKLRSSFEESVKNHMIADVEVGSSLSGGIDSTSFAAYAKFENPKLRTFSYVPQEDKYNEKEFIEESIQKLELANTSVSPGFEDHINIHKEVIIVNDAPALNMSLMSHYLLYRKVKEHGLKVMLSGQGADELLCGYGTYYRPFISSLRGLQKIKELIYLSIAFPGFSSKVIAQFRSKNDYSEFFNAPLKSHSGKKSFKEYYRFIIESGLLPALLNFEDRNAMAHGIEGRMPFLDKDFSSRCHSMDPTLKIRQGIRKHIFRQAMKGIVPDKILDRKDKIGFLSPQELWMEEHAEYFINSIVESIAEPSGWFDDSIIPFIKKVFQKKKKEDYPFVWRVFSFCEFLKI